MATANKTVPWAFATRTTTLATNTTVGTATRHDFSAITIDMPELTRTIRSVKLRVAARDAFTTAISFTGWRIGIKLGAIAFDDVDYASTTANSGDHETLIVERDVTAYFVTNFGSGANQTCQVGVAFATGSASNVNCITAELWVTYDYDNTATTQVKSAEIPIQGHHTTISTSDVEIGTVSGTSNAPANQIPNLSTFCPEAGIAFKQVYLRVTAIDGGAAATNFNLSVKLDAGSYDARATIEQTLVTATPYRDIIDLTASPYSITTNAVHALVMKSSLAATFENISAVLVATYTFTSSGTTRELHSVRIPLENDRSVMDAAMATASGDIDRYSLNLDVQEPGTITLLQSGVVFYDQVGGVAGGTTVTIGNSGQAARTYTHANVVRGGPGVIVRRCDHDSTTWALVRGTNKLTIDCRASVISIVSEIAGYAIVNYTADVPSTGIGTGNRSCSFALASHPTAGAGATIVSAEERLPNFPTTPWKLSGGVFIELGTRGSISVGSWMIQAERQTGEDSEDGWYSRLFSSGNFTELQRRESIRSLTEWVRTNSFKARGMVLTATRRWRVAFAQTNITNAEWCAAVWTTNSDITFTVSGIVTISNIAVTNGNTVKIYADDGVETEYITSTTTTGGTGTFSAQVLDNTRTYFATYDNGGNQGWSGPHAPGASFNINITPIDFTSTDRAMLTDIQSRLPTTLDGSGFIKASIQSAVTDSITAAAVKADAVTKIQSGLALAATALSTAQWTNTRAGLQDNLDAAVSTRAAAATAVSNVDYTSARATKLDDLDATISSRAPASTAVSNVDYTSARATKIDSLDAAVTTRAPASTAVSNVDYTSARATKLDDLDAAISSRAPASTALSTAQWTNVRAGLVDNLDAAITTRAAAATAVSNADLTPTRAANLDNLDAATSTRAPASTALSTAQWTNIRAELIDNLDAAISSRASAVAVAALPSAADYTVARAAKLDNLDATISSRAPSSTALSNADYTSARAAKLDDLDAAISSRAAAATALSTTQWTNVRAGLIDNLDATISSRASAGAVAALPSATDYTPTRAAKLDNLDGTITSRASASALAAVQSDTDDIQNRIPATLDISGNIKAAIQTLATDAISGTVIAASAVTKIQAGLSTSVEVSSIQADTTSLTGRLSNTRAGLLDNLTQLDTAITSRAPASTAVSTTDLTPSRAAKLDNLDATVTSRATQTSVTNVQSRIPTALDGSGNIKAGVQSIISGAVTSIVNGIFDLVIEPGASVKARTFIQQWRIGWSILVGRALNLAISTATNETFRDAANTKNRASFAMGTDGTRTPSDLDGDL